eukprot:3504572-Rhodomonas_salina.1
MMTKAERGMLSTSEQVYADDDAKQPPQQHVDLRSYACPSRVVEAMEQAIAKKPSLRAVGFDFSRDALIEASRIVQQVAAG